jgi:hypothetical protein
MKIRKNEGSAWSDSKVEVLVLMFKFFLAEINLAEAICRSQNKAAKLACSRKVRRGILSRHSLSTFDMMRARYVFYVQSAIDHGSVSEGMSQEVAKTLLQAEKWHACV